MKRRTYLATAGLSLAALAGCTGDSGPEVVDDGTSPQNGGGDQSGGAAGSGGGSGGGGSGDGGGGGEATAAGAAEVQARVGELVSDDALAMVVRSVTRTQTIGEFQEADAGTEFVVVRLAIKNVSADRHVNFSGLLQTRLKDAADYTYDQTFAATGRDLSGGQLVPGEVSRGDVVYQVPTDASGLRLQFDFEAVSFFDLDRVEVPLGERADAIRDLAMDLQVPVHRPGDAVAYRDTTVGVTGVETRAAMGEYVQPDPGNEFVVVDLATTNETGEEQTISTLLQMQLKDGTGQAYSMSVMASSQLARGYEQGSPLDDGETRRGKVAYEVPTDAASLYWAFDFSLWGSGDKAFWQLR
jgi:hypothetical protein